jgi:hypothetical protein
MSQFFHYNISEEQKTCLRNFTALPSRPCWPWSFPSSSSRRPTHWRQRTLTPLSLYFDLNQTEQTTTHAPKPLSRVAENVIIITADEIERMNAHNVAEVLNRVPGFLVQFNGRDFNGSEGLHPQDADFQHVLERYFQRYGDNQRHPR